MDRESTNKDILDQIGEKRTLVNKALHKKTNCIGYILRRDSSWCHWGTDDKRKKYKDEHSFLIDLRIRKYIGS